MRLLLTTLGFIAIVGYSLVGALLMNEWAVVAASELPLATTITQMDAANQPYSAVPGIIFAALGVLLGLCWGSFGLRYRTAFPPWGVLASWATVIGFGAPAFFAASFANMNSVGDTFYDWNSQAAFALEAPLYLTSVGAFLLAVAALIFGFARASIQRSKR